MHQEFVCDNCGTVQYTLSKELLEASFRVHFVDDDRFNNFVRVFVRNTIMDSY